MKTKIFFLSLLTIIATMAMTGCNSEDSSTEKPQVVTTPENEVHTIEYTVTVNGGNAVTRATVESDNQTLKFATGDKLYITGTNIKGVLNITSGAETANATFSGKLTYSGSGNPADDLQLTATLVSAQQTENTHFSVNAAGAVTVNYPTTAYCSSINDAVQKYSCLTGTSTYSAKSFTLSQQTAFLNFTATFKDGTVSGANVTATVNNSTQIASASVTTKEDRGNVVAQFVLPVAVGTTLSSAYVEVGSARFTFGGSEPKTLVGKVYNVARYVTELSKATKDDIGKVADADGKLYDKVSGVPDGKTALAMVAYVGHDSNCDNGLAIALTDASPSAIFSEASNCAKTWNDTTHPFAGGSWRVPSENDWTNMFNGCGNTVPGDFRSKLSSAGATDVRNNYYWTSTDIDNNNAKAYVFGEGNNKFVSTSKTSSWYVRLCLSF